MLRSHLDTTYTALQGSGRTPSYPSNFPWDYSREASKTSRRPDQELPTTCFYSEQSQDVHPGRGGKNGRGNGLQTRFVDLRGKTTSFQGGGMDTSMGSGGMGGGGMNGGGMNGGGMNGGGMNGGGMNGGGGMGGGMAAPVLGEEATSSSQSSYMIDGKLYDTGKDKKECNQACEMLFDDIAVLNRQAEKARATKEATAEIGGAAGGEGDFISKGVGTITAAKGAMGSAQDLMGGKSADDEKRDCTKHCTNTFGWFWEKDTVCFAGSAKVLVRREKMQKSSGGRKKAAAGAGKNPEASCGFLTQEELGNHSSKVTSTRTTPRARSNNRFGGSCCHGAPAFEDVSPPCCPTPSTTEYEVSEVEMRELAVGDEIAVGKTSDGQMKWEKVLCWLHRDETADCCFLEVELQPDLGSEFLFSSDESGKVDAGDDGPFSAADNSARTYESCETTTSRTYSSSSTRSPRRAWRKQLSSRLTTPPRFGKNYSMPVRLRTSRAHLVFSADRGEFVRAKDLIPAESELEVIAVVDGRCENDNRVHVLGGEDEEQMKLCSWWTNTQREKEGNAGFSSKSTARPFVQGVDHRARTGGPTGISAGAVVSTPLAAPPTGRSEETVAPSPTTTTSTLRRIRTKQTFLRVKTVREVYERGFYCPLTSSGELLVDNVRCSCYALPEAYHDMYSHVFKLVSMQAACHYGVWPLRKYLETCGSTSSLMMENHHAEQRRRNGTAAIENVAAHLQDTACASSCTNEAPRLQKKQKKGPAKVIEQPALIQLGMLGPSGILHLAMWTMGAAAALGVV
ncbi:unnamed protein product [Amoebophrya sp. A120]|nr:unnamed protein product [Amoebophrya sp. A120]|eukprot:GSA120T00018823001.1